MSARVNGSAAVEEEGRSTAELAEEELAHVRREDPDMLLIADYMSGALSDLEARRVDERLASDPAFYRLAEPLFRAREAMQAETTRAYSNPYDVEVAWQELRQRLGLAELGETVLHNMLSARMNTAAIRAESATPMGGNSHTFLNARAKRVAGRTLYVLVEIGVLFMVLAGLAPHEPWGPQWNLVTTTHAERRHVQIDDSTSFTLQPDARLTYRMKAMWLMPEEAIGRREMVLDGGASFDLRKPQYKVVRIRTPAATIEGESAAFDVRVSPPCETGVTVRRGAIDVAARQHPDDVVLAELGDKVTIGCDGIAKKGRVASVASVAAEER